MRSSSTSALDLLDVTASYEDYPEHIRHRLGPYRATAPDLQDFFPLPCTSSAFAPERP